MNDGSGDEMWKVVKIEVEVITAVVWQVGLGRSTGRLEGREEIKGKSVEESKGRWWVMDGIC
jgi:hypothetical protein